MKQFYFFLVLIAGMLTASAQTANEFYVRIYNTIEEADTLAANLHNAAALQKYREAQSALQTFQKGNPDWNASIVRFRLSYIADRIAEIGAKLPAGQIPAETAAPQTLTPDPLQGAAATAMEGQLSVLRDQVRLLEAERVRLEAKLKEALSVQPTAVDPRELAKAEQRMQDLQKENELLKVGLEQAKARKTVEPAATPAADMDSENLARQLKEKSERVASLEMEKRVLQDKVAELGKGGASNRSEVERANATISEYRETIARLTSERDSLQEKAKATAAQADNTAALRAENEMLKKQLASRPKSSKGRVRELENEVSGLKQKIEVIEARAVPYTAEEVALFNMPQPGLAQAATSGGQPQEGAAAPARLSASTASLAREAQRDFAAGRLDQAQAKFQEVIKKDKTDVVTLANLAVVQLDLKQLDAAEKSISQALAIAPDDAFSIGVLGRLRWQQKRLDDALGALSRAAKIDPNNPEIQNYLGLVLSEKGMRAPAESALRKAVQLRPSYGSAHQNLAVVYVTQNPPLVELARYHYSKSLAAGAPPNPELEKLIESKRAQR